MKIPQPLRKPQPQALFDHAFTITSLQTNHIQLHSFYGRLGGITFIIFDPLNPAFSGLFHPR